MIHQWHSPIHLLELMDCFKGHFTSESPMIFMGKSLVCFMSIFPRKPIHWGVNHPYHPWKYGFHNISQYDFTSKTYGIFHDIFMIKYGFHNISLRKTMILPANMGISWGFHGIRSSEYHVWIVHGISW